MIILGIETSCDETAAAVLKISDRGYSKRESPSFEILSDVVSSQINLHKKYGGVVPEVAARAHLENILPVIQESLETAKVQKEDLDCLAVTVGPGLVTSLIVGMETAKNLAYLWEKPIIGVNHLEGHIAANFIGGPHAQHPTPNAIKFPAVCLIVSGGHTELVLIKHYGLYQKIGQTRDDAAGEAFDKVAKLLDIGYPGGPVISKLAKEGNPQAFDLPRPMMRDQNFDFSFSGLKTAVLYLTKKLNLQKERELIRRGTKKDDLKRILVGKNDGYYGKQIADLCASFQKAAVDVLVSKTIKAAKKYQAKTVMLAGGVAANSLLRETLEEETLKLKLDFSAPPKNLCTDNAVMIAVAGYRHWLKKDFTDWQDLNADPNLEL